jgi:penicillin-binding protein 2
MDLVRNGMRDAVQTWRGTGHRAAVPGLDVAGKTGTAQYKAKVNGVWERRKHAWMIAYAHSDAPKYALAVLVEDAPHGGGTDAGPIVKDLLLHLFPEYAAAEEPPPADAPAEDDSDAPAVLEEPDDD